MAAEPVRRCAIYTRKSTEEGLEQAFNSLDAQREACAAFVLSQCHEGWTLVPEMYDDGGYSGGTMERPALRNLLADVAAGKIDIIVVYKVDRLTRSLADFAKIVEVLDRQGASFVSVTQAFNTTTSMGRLTLNVLLSFAQFEREVTGERIRDKIAASKARGMWMGGNVPLGYEVRDRKLVVVPEDAAKVRLIYERYLDLGSVMALEADLVSQNLRSKARVSRTGRKYGDARFTRGALYHMLQNRMYIGEVRHGTKRYPGEHAAIIEQELFDAVGARLAANRSNRLNGEEAADPSLLIGKVFDGRGVPMTPDHSSKRGMRYRYYATRAERLPKGEKLWRVPAGDLEGIVLAQLQRHLDLASMSPSKHRSLLAQHIAKVIVHADRIEIMFTDESSISVAAQVVRRGKETRLAISPSSDRPTRQDPALIKLVLKAQLARQALEQSEDTSIADLARQQGYTRDYFGVLLRIAYLAPDILASVLEGRQPVQLNRQRLARATNLPIDWPSQREMLGFA